MAAKSNSMKELLTEVSKKNILIGFDVKKAPADRYAEINSFLTELGAKKVLRTQWELRNTQLSINDLAKMLKPLFRVEDDLRIVIFSTSHKVRLSS